MQIVKKRLPKTHKISFLGCMHEGSILKATNLLQQAILQIHGEPNHYVVLMGDFAECLLIDDPRYDPETIDPNSSSVLLQYRRAIDELKILKPKILTALMGNHDWRLITDGNYVRDMLCRELQVPYGGVNAKIHVQDRTGKLIYKIFATHQIQGLRSVVEDFASRHASLQRQLKRKLMNKCADCLVMVWAHSHRILVYGPPAQLFVTDDGEDLRHSYTDKITIPALQDPKLQAAVYIPPDFRWYAATGGFYRSQAIGVAGYPERLGYDPLDLGYVTLEVEDGIVKTMYPVVM
jgi:hypothetical protein